MNINVVEDIYMSWDRVKTSPNYKEKFSFLVFKRVHQLSSRLGYQFFDLIPTQSEEGNKHMERRELKPDQMKPHALLFVGMLDLMVQLIGPDMESFTEKVWELGRRHVGYGVKSQDYPIFGQALYCALEDFIGPSYFTRQVKESWRTLWRWIGLTMIRGARSMESQQQQRRKRPSKSKANPRRHKSCSSQPSALESAAAISKAGRTDKTLRLRYGSSGEKDAARTAARIGRHGRARRCSTDEGNIGLNTNDLQHITRRRSGTTPQSPKKQSSFRNLNVFMKQSSCTNLDSLSKQSSISNRRPRSPVPHHISAWDIAILNVEKKIFRKQSKSVNGSESMVSDCISSTCKSEGSPIDRTKQTVQVKLNLKPRASRSAKDLLSVGKEQEPHIPRKRSSTKLKSSRSAQLFGNAVRKLAGGQFDCEKSNRNASFNQFADASVTSVSEWSSQEEEEEPLTPKSRREGLSSFGKMGSFRLRLG